MSDLPPGHGFGRTPPCRTSLNIPKRSAPRAPSTPRAACKRAGRARDRPVPASHAPSAGVVQVTHDNAPQVQAVLLQQVRDWQIRNHRLLREATYYLRCIAENRAPKDDEAREAINAPPEKLP